MKKIFLILCVFLCELCYSQEKQKVFLCPNKDISYEPALLDKIIKQILSVDSQSTFNVYKEEDKIDDNAKLLRLQQYLGEYRILGGNLLVYIKDNKIVRINGSYYPSVESAKKSYTLSKSEILEIAEKEVFASKSGYDFQYEMEKTISKNYFDNDDKSLHYAYRVTVADNKDVDTYVDVIIDENTGRILKKTSRIRHTSGTADTRYNGTRVIETSHITSPVSSKYILKDSTRGNGIYTKNFDHGNNIYNAIDFTDSDNYWSYSEFHNSEKDDGALDAHWAAMKTYDYFYNTFQRNSYDNAGAAINCYLHLRTNYDNASWHPGFNAFYFGDGSTERDILTSIDIVAHEIGHAICDYTAQLEYYGEPGALCEGLSDIWGACVENTYGINKQTWLCGEDIELRPGHVAMRSMSNPNIEEQPDTYGGTYWEQTIGCVPSGNNDNCGVHTNNGVLNYWFYLLSKGGSGTNDLNNAYNVIGIGIDNAAKIVYRVETEYMEPETDFSDMREYTIAAATELFPNNPWFVNSVANAWYAVGIGSCSHYTLANQTITTNNSINQCSVEVYNVTVGSNASLYIEFQQETVLSHDVEIQLGSTLEIQP